MSRPPPQAASGHTFVGAAGVGREDARRHWLHRLRACDGVQAPGLRKAQHSGEQHSVQWLSKDFLGSFRRFQADKCYALCFDAHKQLEVHALASN